MMTGNSAGQFFGTIQSEEKIKKLQYKLAQSEDDRRKLSSLCHHLKQEIENQKKKHQQVLSSLEQEKKQFETQDYSLVANKFRELIELSQEKFIQQLKYTQEELQAIQNNLIHLHDEQLKNNQYVLNQLIELFQKSVESPNNIKQKKGEIKQENNDLDQGEIKIFGEKHVPFASQSYQTKEVSKKTQEDKSFLKKDSRNILRENQKNTFTIANFLRNPGDLKDLLANYNSAPRALLRYITKIDSTPESIQGKRSGAKPPMFFSEISNGIYWLVNQPSLQDNHNFLVPKAGLVINDANYQTLEGIFYCDGYENKTSNQFELIIPAIVKKLSHDKWQLIEAGQLKFKS